jgi:hypothetical protein
MMVLIRNRGDRAENPDGGPDLESQLDRLVGLDLDFTQRECTGGAIHRHAGAP